MGNVSDILDSEVGQIVKYPLDIKSGNFMDAQREIAWEYQK